MAIPENIKNNFNPIALNHLDDTDFDVDKLYDFASDMGITTIKANYNRWVIDLNRSPNNKNLYDDGRIITSLTPTTDFFGRSIYRNKQSQPSSLDIKNLLDRYYIPYYNEIKVLLKQMVDKFGIALLWDAHSIRRNVPRINNEPFADLILGNNDQLSCNKNLIDVTLTEIRKSNYSLTHNIPFKGGNITRYFGKPDKGINALQLEMSKDCYMDDGETIYDHTKAQKMKRLLQRIFNSLTEQLQV